MRRIRKIDFDFVKMLRDNYNPHLNYLKYTDFETQRSEVPKEYVGASEVGKLFTAEGMTEMLLQRKYDVDPFETAEEEVFVKMRMGKALESLATEILVETDCYNIEEAILNKKDDESDDFCFLPFNYGKKNTFFGATADGFIKYRDGELGILEIKTSGSENLKKELKNIQGTGVLMPNTILFKYYSQCQLGMHLTGLKKASLFVLFFSGLHIKIDFEVSQDWLKIFKKNYKVFINNLNSFINLSLKEFKEVMPSILSSNISEDDAFHIINSALALDLTKINVDITDIKDYKNKLEKINLDYSEALQDMKAKYRDGMKDLNNLTSEIYKKMKAKNYQDGIYTLGDIKIILNSNEHYINKRVKIL